MGRLVAINLLLFLLPFALYAGWLLYRNGKIQTEDWTVRAVGGLIVAGGICFIIGLVVLTSFSGADPDADYRPAQIRDGQVVPGGFGDE